MTWNDRPVVEPADQGRFRARIDDGWVALQGVNGGAVAAAALIATETALRSEGVDPATTHLRAASFGYVNGTDAGEFDIEVDVVRRGRSLVTTHARTVQHGRTTVVARFHHSAPWEGARYSDVAPMPERPATTVPLVAAGNAVHFDRVETHLHPATALFGGGPRAEWVGWSRPRHGSGFDSAWLVMFGDYFPPAVFARNDGPSRAVTVEYGIQIHSAAARWTLPDDGYLTAHVHAFHSADGFAVEDGRIHLPDGTLLATTRQTRLAG